MYTFLRLAILFSLVLTVPFTIQSQNNWENLSISELDSLRNLSHQKGDYESELFYATKSIEKIKAINAGDSTLAVAMGNMGRSYLYLGDKEKAEPIYLNALTLIKKVFGEEHIGYSKCLNELAILYEDMGKYEEAKLLHLQNIRIKKQLVGENHSDYALSLNNLASLYYVMHKLEDALPLFEQATAIWKKTLGEKSAYYGSSLNNLAALHQQLQHYELSEKLYLKAAALRKAILGEKHPEYTISLNNLGALYFEMKHYDQAKTFFLQAAAIRMEVFGPKHPYAVQSLNNLAGLYGQMGDFELSKQTFRLALQHNAFTKDSIQLNQLLLLANYDFGSINQAIKSVEGLGKLYKTMYDSLNKTTYLLERQKSFDAAIAIYNKIRNEFNLESDKLRNLSQVSRLVSDALDNNALLLKKETNKEQPAIIAFGNAEENKSILLADAIKSNRARTIGDLPDSLVQLELTLQEETSKLKRAKISATSDEAMLAVEKEENALNLKVNHFKQLLKDKYPQYHHLKYENIVAKASDIQALLDDNSLLLEYFVADTACYLFAISKNTVEMFPISISKKELNTEIKSFRKALSDYTFIINNKNNAYELYSRKAFWFYKNLLKIALDGKKVSNLIIIADGELGHLPFEAFLLKEANQTTEEYNSLHYLVNDYNISYDYSATLFVAAKQHFTKKEGNNPQKAMFGAGQLLACAATYPPLDSSLLALRGSSLYSLRGQLIPLPAAQNEVLSLSNLFQGEFLLGNSTNESYFKNNAHQYGIIHLAMHGILNPKEPILSALAFSENKDSLEDNFLQAYEIAHLHLNADLVVLSACETGYGKFEQGEGIISLARSFMYAGVPSLVVSLWQVNDGSTAMIMASFYNNLATGMPKDAALRQAKLDYIKTAQGIAAHPAFWSAFIQLGDSCSISIAKKGGVLANYGWLIVVGFILAGGYFFLLRKKMA